MPKKFTLVKRESFRPTAGKRGYDRAWAKFSRLYRNLNPFCVRCGAFAQCVDHITPLSLGGAKYEESNLQALCLSCHSKKTLEDGSHGDRFSSGV